MYQLNSAFKNPFKPEKHKYIAGKIKGSEYVQSVG